MTSYVPVSSSLEVKESTVVGTTTTTTTTAEEEKEKDLKAPSTTIIGEDDDNSIESNFLFLPNNNHHHHHQQQQQQHAHHHHSSNAAIFFFLGSILYFAIDIWDLPDDEDDDDEEEDYDYNNGYDDDHDDDDDMVTIQLFSSTATLSLSPYYIVTSLAALCYVIDATLSITQQFKQQYSHRPEGSSSLFLSFCWNESPLSPSPTPTPTSPTTTTTTTTTQKLSNNTSTIPRDAIVIELILAITFGVGAILEFSSNAFFEDSTRSQWTMTYLSVHSYLLHAIVLMIFTYLMTTTKTTTTTNFWWGGGRKKRCSFAIVYSWITLEAVGDLFFVIGSIIDVVLVYKFRIPKQQQQQIPMIFDESEVAAMAYGEVCSSTMWLIDSILYLIVDFYDFGDDDSSSSSSSSSKEEEESMSNHDDDEDDDVGGDDEMVIVSPLIDKHDDDDEEEENNTSKNQKVESVIELSNIRGMAIEQKGRNKEI